MFFAFATAKPVKNDEEVLKQVADLLPTDVKFNDSKLSGIPMMTSASRQAYYPITNGMGYHNLQQFTIPSSHYPNGWSQQMQQAPLWGNNMQFKDDQHTEARTFGHLRPSLYSQYQTISPQSYVAAPITPAYHYQPYEYATPLESVFGHYSSLSSYPSWFRNNAEELKSRQLWNALPSQKYISPIQPSVSYASNYLFEKPVSTYSNIEGISQPQMYQSMPMLLNKEAPVHSQFRDADSAEAQLPPRGADIMIDNQYNMQIPQRYLVDKLQGFSAPQMSAVPQRDMWVQPQMSRAAEQSQLQTMEYAPSMFQNEQSNFKSLETNQQIQDPYVTPQDQVYIEPFIPDPGHVQGSRAAGLEIMPTWYNHRQELRMAQMKGFYDAMQLTAANLEHLDQQYVKEREMVGKSSESTSFRKDQLTDTMKSNEQMQPNSEKKLENPKLIQGKDVAPSGKLNDAAGIARN